MATIRRAAISDAPAMGHIHVRAWQAAYRGDMPDAYLDGLSAKDRERMWTKALGEPDESRVILVALDEEGVVGFAAVGPATDGSGGGELYSINVDPDRWGTGAGRALLESAESELSALGHTTAMLWVLPTNDRARRFYEAAGWVTDREHRTTEVLGVVVEEVRYRRSLTPVDRPR